MRARGKLRCLLILLVGVAVGCAESASPSAPTPEVSVEALLVDDPPLPPTWLVGSDPSPRPVAWQRAYQEQLGGDCSGHTIRVWSEGGKERSIPQVLQSVCGFPTVEEAEGHYMGHLESTITANGANFDLNAPHRQIYPSKDSIAPLHADEHELVCAAGSATGTCWVWTYFARYGQYVVWLSYHGLEGGIPLKPFERLLHAVDAHLAQQLGLSQP